MMMMVSDRTIVLSVLFLLSRSSASNIAACSPNEASTLKRLDTTRPKRPSRPWNSMHMVSERLPPAEARRGEHSFLLHCILIGPCGGQGVPFVSWLDSPHSRYARALSASNVEFQKSLHSKRSEVDVDNRNARPDASYSRGGNGAEL